MAKRLRVDSHFIPCAVATGDELYSNGIFVFNITKMIKYIQENTDEITMEAVAVDDFFSSFSSINASHLDLVEIEQPVILAEISPGQYNLIDGNHRMEKARKIGIKSMLAYRLNVDQHMRFLTNQKAYVAYIEYWNSKWISLKS